MMQDGAALINGAQKNRNMAQPAKKLGSGAVVNRAMSWGGNATVQADSRERELLESSTSFQGYWGPTPGEQ